MEHTSEELIYRHAPQDKSTKTIWKTFWILLAITIVEIVFAFIHLEYHWPARWILNGFFIIMTLFKAYFIVDEFMHLGHEVKNLIMTIIMPLLLFVWFIIAFLYEGDAWKNLRKDLAPGTPAAVEAPAAPAHGAHH
ncbi:hypothetical protein COR50_03820 [Chitinophaga caeni]|uniref:Cytochrome C oxidase subunit IV n=1 Tax=Chitinophaga caeni TaxID=2029983 RepID=A0A291R0N6_9BACT|nr:cytochrome C oxidase subunit IV family protein [Chitinophaga caeni]ATL49721.1 hypothetical protein COR50_03820 [Chitinophaga caeni]